MAIRIFVNGERGVLVFKNDYERYIDNPDVEKIGKLKPYDELRNFLNDEEIYKLFLKTQVLMHKYRETYRLENANIIKERKRNNAQKYYDMHKDEINRKRREKRN